MHTYFIMCKNRAGGESKDPGMKCVHFILNPATVQMLQVESGGLEPRPSVSFLFRAAPTGGKRTRKWNLRKRKLQTAERRRNARGRAHVQLYNLKSA